MKTAQMLQQDDISLPTAAAPMERTSNRAVHSAPAVRASGKQAVKSALFLALLADAGRASARYVEEYSAARGAE